MYKVFEHTADIGIEVESENIERAFEEAAYAMISLSVNIENVNVKEKREIKINANSLESLLVKFLNEILYLFDAEQFVTKMTKVRIQNLDLYSELSGEKYDRSRHGSYLVIKAVTYHMIAVDPSGKLRVIFDI
ncbi:MAG: archease [Thermoplasmata archaeon]|nr:archease [Thermoplasmata archaeon]